MNYDALSHSFKVSGTEKVTIDTTGNIGIATTTPNYLLTISSATAPQLSLSAGAGINQWVFRNEGGELAFATSTYSATSSVSALRINTNGQIQISNLATAGFVKSSATGILSVDTGTYLTSTSIDTIAELNAILTSEDVASTTWAGASSLITLGTVATGIWNGTSILPAYGGTGLGAGGLASTFIPFGNGTSAFATSTDLSFVNSTLVVTNASTTNATTTNMVVGFDGAAHPGCLAIQDNDSAGWTYCYTLNGTMTCGTVDCSGTGTSTLMIGR